MQKEIGKYDHIASHPCAQSYSMTRDYTNHSFDIVSKKKTRISFQSMQTARRNTSRRKTTPTLVFLLSKINSTQMYFFRSLFSYGRHRFIPKKVLIVCCA